MKLVALRTQPLRSFYGADLSFIERLRRFKANGWDVSIHFLVDARVPWIDPFTTEFPFTQNTLSADQNIFDQWKQIISGDQADIYFVALHNVSTIQFILAFDSSKLWAYSYLQTYPAETVKALQKVPLIFVSTVYVQKALQALLPNAQVTVLPNPCDYFQVLPFKSKTYWLLVNPIASKGRDFAISLATSLPGESFLFVKNWNKSDIPQNLPTNVSLMEHQLDMAPVYANAKGVLMPSSREETFGRVTMEAMLCGLPVIASNLGALPEVVGTGGLSLPLDLSAWAAAMKTDLALLSKNAMAVSAAHQASCNLAYGNLKVG